MEKQISAPIDKKTAEELTAGIMSILQVRFIRQEMPRISG